MNDPMAHMHYSAAKCLAAPCVFLACLSLTSCQSGQAESPPSIEFTRVPPAAHGDSERLEEITGLVKGGQAGERIVVFALSGVWWVQPWEDRPFTTIRA